MNRGECTAGKPNPESESKRTMKALYTLYSSEELRAGYQGRTGASEVAPGPIPGQGLVREARSPPHPRHQIPERHSSVHVAGRSSLSSVLNSGQVVVVVDDKVLRNTPLRCSHLLREGCLLGKEELVAPKIDWAMVNGTRRLGRILHPTADLGRFGRAVGRGQSRPQRRLARTWQASMKRDSLIRSLGSTWPRSHLLHLAHSSILQLRRRKGDHPRALICCSHCRLLGQRIRLKGWHRLRATNQGRRSTRL